MKETKFKQTEVGRIPEDWEVKAIGDVTNVVAGGTPSTLISEYWGGSIPWMNSGELNLKKVDDVEGRITEQGLKNSSTHLIPPYCVLIGLAGQGKTRGTAAYNTIRLCTNQSIAAIYPSKSFNSIYAYYYLDSMYENLRSLSEGGGGRGGLTKKLLEDFRFPLPPLAEQERIASALTAADNLIASLDKQIAKTRNLKQATMQRLLSSLPNHVEYKVGDVCSITDFTAAGSFADIAANVKYITDFKGYAQLIRTVDLKSNLLQKNKFVYVDEHAFEYLWRVNLDCEALVLPNVGNCGEVYYITPNMFLCEHNVLGPNAILLKSNSLHVRFLYYLFETKEFQATLSTIIAPSGQTKFNKTQFKELNIPVPPIEEQKRIASILTAMDRQIAALEKKRSKYEMVKQGMMQQLLTGTIRLI